MFTAFTRGKSFGLPPGWEAAAGVSGTFSPASLPNLLAWLDAQDASTITQSGGRVSQWDSKVGSFSFVQAAAGDKPIVGAGISGLPTVYFDGSVNERFMLGAFTYSGGPIDGVTVYIVGRLVTAAGPVQSFVGPDTGNTVRVGASSTIVRFEWNGGAGSTVWTEPVALGTGIGRRLCMQVDISGVNAAIAGTIDNAPLTGGYSTGPAPVGTAGATSMKLGDGPLAGNMLDGHIGEILVYKGLHDAPTRALVDNYLKTKWGL